MDTSALLVFFDTDEPDHEAVSDVISRAVESLVVSPYVVAELDDLIASRLGVTAGLAVLAELGAAPGICPRSITTDSEIGASLNPLQSQIARTSAASVIRLRLERARAWPVPAPPRRTARSSS